jgi:hypothetical protein
VSFSNCECEVVVADQVSAQLALEGVEHDQSATLPLVAIGPILTTTALAGGAYAMKITNRPMVLRSPLPLARTPLISGWGAGFVSWAGGGHGTKYHPANPRRPGHRGIVRGQRQNGRLRSRVASLSVLDNQQRHLAPRRGSTRMGRISDFGRGRGGRADRLRASGRRGWGRRRPTHGLGGRDV